ncbi:MAG: hypothetical protein HQK56_20260, partial [Deltaproteobacteria bacterium]|nr:hypothetical protein [Deltaproteobacteria bacterium]
QYFVNPDHLGSPRSIIDSTGATVWKWDKDPFGNGAPTGTLPYNLRFPGQYFDVETGLCYNMARDYSPGLGRYIQSDPIGLGCSDVNLYVYVQNDPINLIDPDGLQAIPLPLLPPLIPPEWPRTKIYPPPSTTNQDSIWEEQDGMCKIKTKKGSCTCKFRDAPKYLEAQCPSLVKGTGDNRHDC